MKRVTNSVIKLVDASPVRGGVGVNCFADLHPEKYWKNKKYYKLIVENCRLVRFVVLDVELCSSPFSVVGEERRPSKTQNGTDNNGVPLFKYKKRVDYSTKMFAFSSTFFEK